MPTEQDGILIGTMREFLKASRGKSQRSILEDFLQKIIHSGHFSKAGSILINSAHDRKLRLFNPDNFLTKNGYLREGEPWQAEFEYGVGIAGQTFLDKKTILVQDAAKDPRFSTVEGQVSIRGMICVPIMLDDESDPFGIASFHNYDPQDSFADNALDHAEMYAYALALALAASTGKLPPTPVAEKRVFIGSATEDLGIARAIQKQLQNETDALVLIWNQGTFKPGSTVLETLLRTVNEYDFGVFLFSAHDLSDIRGKKYLTVRDNVVFEAGLFFGQLGRDRTFLVVPKVHDLKLPSDLEGLITIRYAPPSRDADIGAAAGGICTDLIDAIKRLSRIHRPH